MTTTVVLVADGKNVDTGSGLPAPPSMTTMKSVTIPGQNSPNAGWRIDIFYDADGTFEWNHYLVVNGTTIFTHTNSQFGGTSPGSGRIIVYIRNLGSTQSQIWNFVKFDAGSGEDGTVQTVTQSTGGSVNNNPTLPFNTAIDTTAPWVFVYAASGVAGVGPVYRVRGILVRQETP